MHIYTQSDSFNIASYLRGHVELDCKSPLETQVLLTEGTLGILFVPTVKNLKKVGCVTYPVFEGVCDETGESNMKRIKEILTELYFPQLRQFRQVT